MQNQHGNAHMKPPIDMQELWDFVTEGNPRCKFPPENIVLWGRSIGACYTMCMTPLVTNRAR